MVLNNRRRSNSVVKQDGTVRQCTMTRVFASAVQNQNIRQLLVPPTARDLAPEDEEERDAHAATQLEEAWRTLSSGILQEVSWGRTVSLKPVGSFFAMPTPGTNEPCGVVAFQFNEKFLKDKNLRVQDSMGEPPLGPVTKLKSDRVSKSVGWSKAGTEMVLQHLMKDISSAVGTFAEVDFEFPGLGSICSVSGTITFKPEVAKRGDRRAAEPLPVEGLRAPLPAPPRVTAGSRVFGSTGLMLRRNNSQPLKPILHRASSSAASSRATTPSTPEANETRPLNRTMGAKSSSSPSLAAGGSDAILAHSPKDASNSITLHSLRKTFNGGRRSPLMNMSFSALETSASPSAVTRALPTNDQLYPPLLDRCSRMQSALFREEVDIDLVSNVVASNYSRPSQGLTLDPSLANMPDSVSCILWKRSRVDRREKVSANDGRAVDVQNIDWTSKHPTIHDDSDIFEELVEAGMPSNDFCRMLSRYRHYASHGVPSDVLAPYNKQWLDHAYYLLDMPNQVRWNGIGNEQRYEVLEEVRTEILKVYLRAAKQAVIDYALLDQRTRERLDIHFIPMPVPVYGGIPFTVPDIGTFGGPPQEWRESIGRSRAALLNLHVQNSRTALALKDFWLRGCADIRLLSLPAKYAEMREIGVFHQQQVAQLDMSIRQLTEAWNTVVQIVAEEPVFLNGGNGVDLATTALRGRGSPLPVPPAVKQRPAEMEDLFFEAVAALLSQMAREVVEQTLREYVEFFERFADLPLDYEQVKALTSQDTWQDEFLVNKLVAGIKDDVNGIRFAKEQDFIKGRLLLSYKECTTSLAEFKRPDTRLRDVVNGRTMLWEVKEDEDHIRAGYLRIDQIIRMNLSNAEKVLELYQKYLFLLDEHDRVMEFFEDQSKSREDYVEYIEHIRSTLDELQERCPNTLMMQMVQVDAGEVNRKLLQCGQDCVARLLKLLANRNVDRSGRLVKQFELLDARIQREPTNEDQLVELEAMVESAQEKDFPALLDEYEDIKEWIWTTWDMEHLLHEADYRAIWMASKWKGYATDIENRKRELEEDRVKIESKLTERRNKFLEHLVDMNNRIGKFKEKGNTRALDEYTVLLDDLKKQLSHAEGQKEDIQKKEEMLGWEMTEFEQLDQAFDLLDPYDKLWSLVAQHQECNRKWTRSPLFSGDIDPNKVESDVQAMWRTSFKLKAQFEQDKVPKPENVATKVKADLDAFKEHVPLLHALLNPGLRDRHWKDISAVVGFTLEPDPTITLQKLIDMDVGGEIDRITEISESAGKEYQIESGLAAQIAEWEPVKVELMPWASTGTFIVAGATIDECQTLLDDHVIKTQTMKGSPFAVQFKEKIEDWENYLKSVQDTIDVWLKVQQVWLYLEPIFTSEDIMQQMPVEGRLFREVDRSWREIMALTSETIDALKVFRLPNFLQNLEVAHEKLETVQKGLNDYLETKRLFFPRFFFLSNDNLLEILSETKDPSRVNPHMKKAFEGIQSLHFEEDLKITKMISSEKEPVDLTNIIDPIAANGAVEKWLVQVEEEMITTIRDISFKATEDYPTKEFKEWVQDWPGQVVIGIFNLFWTQQIDTGLAEKGSEALVEYSVYLGSLMADLVALVRNEIPKLVRCTLEALIVIFVHNDDTVKDLAKLGVSKKEDFDWLVQLRYYIETNPDKPEQQDLFVRITNSFLGYAYEYIGNCGRLVVTPLTDRCYRTCCGALHLLYGAAPEGPAGTGKTETVKDLAKALARFCVVFNCSDELDTNAMAKMFKGLASSGGWACYDEFNRIDAEVLSVIAQQVLCIQNAIKARLHEFDFEGTHLPLKWTCNSFITMNPGYAGRAELPDNLKALYRTVAMMVPDYAMIAQIKLYSYGYEDATSLAQKIVTTYKLCSEQLSSQKHYDYGMRAVFSVLVAAGNGKRKYPTENESILMLRAISDVNLAKFLQFDVPLFNGITSDLFPGIVLPKPDFGALIGKLEYHLKATYCMPHPYFIEKIIQFYECHIVRHSVMLVGAPFSGKTTALNTLQSTLTDLAEEGTFAGATKTWMSRLNPKSIPATCLYGSFDEVSHEWTDGIVAVLFRDFGRNQTEERKWLVFDGPIDAVWIENMNTVMDENKKLCLNSGEIIAMSPNMRTIMEPMDVNEASPATISRNGMVFFEPHLMGYQHLLDKTFASKFPEIFGDEDKEETLSMTAWLLGPCIQYMRENCREVSPTQDQNLVQSYLKLLISHIEQAVKLPHFAKTAENEGAAKKNYPIMIDALVIFSLVWAIGSVTDTDYRGGFNTFLRSLIKGQAEGITAFKKVTPDMPDRGTVFDYVFNLEKMNWNTWSETVEPQQIPAGSATESIIVQTMDNVRYRYFLNHCIKNRIMLLFCGPTGTGKTAYMQQALMNLSKDAYMQIMLGFSAQSKCAQTQDLIDLKLDRRKKGTYGPPPGKLCVVMVDDLNMPNKETYGAQPPIEILRQGVDALAYQPDGGWFDRKDSTHPFRYLIDILLFAAMGPPGGGRTFITPRMLGHFFLIGFPNLDDDNMTKIFQTILEWKFNQDNYPGEVSAMAKKLVVGTLEMYKWSVASLLPTPLKVHYTFNLRDFAKIVAGILLLKKGDCDGAARHVRLWVHEVWRVIGDRLVDDQDRVMLLQQARGVAKQCFGMGIDECMKHLDLDGDGKIQTLDEVRNLIFGDMMSQPAAPNRPYSECLDVSLLQKTVESHLDQYNLMSAKKMNLVCFLYMLEHLSRVARVVKTPGGNALLVGVGGSGRQSCARLACFLADFDVFQIEITRGYDGTAFREDLKKLLIGAGGKATQTVFLFTDSQIKKESFVEDLNNLLNAGEVPNLYAADEKIQVCELVRKDAARENKAPEGTPTQLYAYFVERCKKFLVVVLCFSPIGDSWRARLRSFPSLVNCCTIDWFTEWPSDALTAVANRFLGDVEMDDKVKESCEAMCSIFHSQTRELAIAFKDQLKRIYYATPTSFLELIQTFKQLLKEKRQQVNDLIDKYSGGVEKILNTEKSVEGMKVELIDLQPKLVAKNTEVEQMMVVVGQETEKTLAVKELVAVDEKAAAESAAKSEAQKCEVEADLAEAMPALEEAMSALDTLTQKDIGEIKAMKDPPGPVKLVLSAVCIIKGIKPARVKDDSGKMVEDYWGPSVKMVGENKFLESLITYDKDNIPPAIVKKIGTFTGLDDFQPARVKTVSSAAWGICMWVRAMETYDKTAKIVGPKKEALAIAEAEYAEVMAKLKEKQAELQIVLDKQKALEDKLNGLEQEKADLAYQVDLCAKKIDRAEQLIDSLGGEKSRWTENAAQLRIDYVNLTGDVIVSSGLIAYLGAFTPDFRESQVKQWVDASQEKAIPGSEVYNFETILGEPVNIRNWVICGLPNDAFSIANGIVISKARRWPLCIDPQGQANKWIKKMEAPQQVKIAKFTDGDYLRRMEGAITFGNPVLIENILEDTDPAIEPILLKQTYKQGNRMMLKLGDSTLEYNKEFKLYLTTKLRNPHYLPEVAVKVTLLNFMITMVGLQDQLLGYVVEKELAEMAEEKARLVVEGAENKKALEDAENKILHVLQTSQGNILEDESAINILSSSKALANKIAAKQEIAEATEKQIDEARLGYVPVAFNGSILFFCIADLANIDPMYQYSLPFFVSLFLTSMDKAEPASELAERIENLNDNFRYTLYANICRSLFEKHKTLFSFLLCIRMLLANDQVEMSDYRFLLTGGVSLEDPPPKPADWIPERCWGEVFRLSKIHERYDGFPDKFTEELDIMREVYDDVAPMRIMKNPATRPRMMKELDDFQDILMLRAIRPDRVVPAVLAYISGKMGERFVSPPPFDLAGSYADSNNMSPLIFVLSPGADPGSALFRFAEDKNKDLNAISLGQGQGVKAERLMDIATVNGSWVLLQNCHLATSWMPKLERILEAKDPKTVHRDYRLWLTSYPSDKFPVAILQSGVKMTNEAPKGLRANMTGSYLMSPICEDDFFEGCEVADRNFKRYLFNLCFFHAVAQERRLFGPLGWNIAYEFTENDLRISAMQLKMFLEEYPEEVPLKAINYLTGECNYGGRVTEMMDRRLIVCLLSQYYCIEALEDDFTLYDASGDGGPTYTIPGHGSRDLHMEHIKSLPLVSPPGVFGFHENANLTKEMGETYTMMRELLLTMGAGSSGGGAGPDEVVGEIANDVLARLAKPWNIAKVQEKYPVLYEESMNTVLAQELTRFNGLINAIRGSLQDIQKAVKGLLLMSSALEVAFFEIFDGKTPGMWIKASYPSLKPLGGYVNDLIERLKFFQTWVDNGKPVNFWFSGIYFQQAFTTGASQNFARKYAIAIDTLTFDFNYPRDQDPQVPPENGVFTYGIFFEACKWNWDTWVIDESDPKVLYVPVPMIELIPCKKTDMKEFPHYVCPCYKISTRKGVLSTTGHSTNYVMPIKVPSLQAEDHWIKRGCAMLTSLDT